MYALILINSTVVLYFWCAWLDASVYDAGQCNCRLALNLLALEKGWLAQILARDTRYSLA